MVPNVSSTIRVRRERGSGSRGMGSGRETVSHAPHGLDPARLSGIVLDGSAQAQHGDVYGAVVALAGIVVARQGQKTVAGERFARVADQGFKQVDVAPRQFEIGSAHV